MSGPPEEDPAGTETAEGSGLPPSGKDVLISTGISPVAELYYPFLCSVITSIAILYCAICIIRAIYKTTALHNWHYFFVANFMVCDIAFVLLTLVPGALVSLYGIFNPHFQGISCKLMIASTFPYVAGFFMLVAIAIDSMLSVGLPFKYKKIMGIRLALTLVVIAWCSALLFFVPLITDETTEKTKSSFCKWDEKSRAIVYGTPLMLTTIISVSLYVYLYRTVLRSWRDVRQSSDPSTKKKMNLFIEGLLANRKLATNLLLLTIVPMIFGFLYPVLDVLSSSVGGDFKESPYLVYVVIPYIGIASIIVRSILFGFRLHSQVKVWSFKCLH